MLFISPLAVAARRLVSAVDACPVQRVADVGVAVTLTRAALWESPESWLTLPAGATEGVLYTRTLACAGVTEVVFGTEIMAVAGWGQDRVDEVKTLEMRSRDKVYGFFL